jgi:hypothetical protein
VPKDRNLILRIKFLTRKVIKSHFGFGEAAVFTGTYPFHFTGAETEAKNC